MTQFTPDEIRAAAAVVRAYGAPPHVRTQSETETLFRTTRILDDIATRTEREQAKQAQREKRIKQLTDELIEFAYPGIDFPPVSDMRVMGHIARALIDRYPALVEAPEVGR